MEGLFLGAHVTPCEARVEVARRHKGERAWLTDEERSYMLVCLASGHW